jgi:hypothetical protein
MPEPVPLPIACTLTGASLEERGRWLRRLGAEALVGARRDADRLVLRFRPAALAEVRELVRAEGECCPFLEFRVEEAPGQVMVAISGPADAAPVLDAFLAQMAGSHAG